MYIGILYKRTFWKVFYEFQLRNIIDVEMNETSVFLIPKKEKANEVQNFRPISLITRLYKIITNVLTKRLRALVPFPMLSEPSLC